jgi:hypothetical protein
MRGTSSEVIGLFASIVTVALIVAVITRGGKTAQVITAAGNVFTRSLSIAIRGQ